MSDLVDVMNRLANHILEHKGKFTLSVTQDHGAGPPVWAAEIVNDNGSYLCTSYMPHEAIESLLGEVHA